VNNGTAWRLREEGFRDPTRDRRRASTPLYEEPALLFQHKGTKNARENLS
jgi:hypothetical protein